MMTRTRCSLFLVVLSTCCAGSLVSAQSRTELSGSGSMQKPAVRSVLPIQTQQENSRLLGLAIVYHDLAGVRKAMDRGIDVKSQDAVNALTCAVSPGDLEIVQLLLERGVARGDTRTLTDLLLLAITNAHTSRHLPMMEALIAAGADVHRRSPTGETLLMYAFAQPPVEAQDNKQGASAGATTTWQILLAHGVSVNAKNDLGHTALMGAAANGSLDMIRALIAAGANVNAKTDNGDTALSSARSFHRTDVIDLLQKAGATE